MVMRRTLLTVLAVELALIGLGLTACTEDPLEPQEAAFLADAHGTNWNFDTDVVQSVSGSGHLVGEPVERTVTFDIRKRADGSVHGFYHSLARGPGGAHIRVRIECLHVTGNQAWATGTIVAAIDPDNIGRPYSVRFIDNGEGANAPPDEIGTEQFVDYDCATEPDRPVRQLTIGNLLIRS